MYSYTATIGRNVGDTPMSDSEWETFIDEVTSDLSAYARSWDSAVPDAVEIHRGQGSWGGVVEDSVKVTLLTEVSLGDNALSDLRRKLSENARLYNQDAIALTIGVSELC